MQYLIPYKTYLVGSFNSMSNIGLPKVMTANSDGSNEEFDDKIHLCPGVIKRSVRHDRTSYNKEILLKPKVIDGINCNQ